MYTFIVSFIKQNISALIYHSTVVFLIWVMEMIVPYLSGVYIDNIVESKEIQIIVFLVLIIAISNFIQILLKYIQALSANVLGNTLTHKLCKDIFQKIFVTEAYVYKNCDNAYLVDQINKDSRSIVQFLITNTVNFILQVLTVVISMVVIFKADSLLSILVVILVPLYIFTLNLFKEKIRETKAEAKENNNEYFSHELENISKLPYIKQHSLYNEMRDRLVQSFNKMLDSTKNAIHADYAFINLNQLVITVSYLCIIGIGGYKVSIGELSIGYFTVINTYYNMILRSISYFLGFAGIYQDAKISLERIYIILEKPEERYGNQSIDSINEVHVQDLNITYDKNRRLVYPDITFEKGNIYGIKGANGCGKTTFMNAIMGIYNGEPKGKVLYNGSSISNFNMKVLRRINISYLDQTPTMFNMSVREYLAFGISMTMEIEQRQKTLLSLFGIEYLYDKKINENGNTLSGGEKQKLSMVKAFSKDSSLILLDEPTTALDKTGTSKLIELLHDRKKDAIIVLISHENELLLQCDKLIDLTYIESKA